MLENLMPFLLHWGITALSLWVASHIFSGLKFDDASSLIVSALLLGFANAIIKPLLIVLTLPLTLLTFGLFVLVINALMILLVAWLVKGFQGVELLDGILCKHVHLRAQHRDRLFRQRWQLGNQHTNASRRHVALNAQLQGVEVRPSLSRCRRAGTQFSFNGKELSSEMSWPMVDVNHPDRSVTTLLAGGSGE